MIDSHPATLYRHEPDSLAGFPAMPELIHADQYDNFNDELQAFLLSLPKLDRVRESGSLPVFRKNAESGLNRLGRYALVGALRLASRRIGNVRVPAIFQPPEKEGLSILWKSVNSVGRLAAIKKAGAPIKIIVLIRHPGGMIASILKGMEQGVKAPSPRSKIIELANSHSPYITQQLPGLKNYNHIELEAFRWAVLNSHAITQLENQPGCMLLKYEDLCANPLRVMQDVLKFADLPWHRQVESFVQRSISKNSSRYYGLHRKPENIDTWRQSMPGSVQSRIMQIVKGSEAGDLYPE